jgi:hypothetical protein
MNSKLIKLNTGAELLFCSLSTNSKFIDFLKSNDVAIVISHRFNEYDKAYHNFKIICKFGIGNIATEKCYFEILI